jgi:hypothetical protein
MICNLEIYEFTKLQSCFLAISDLQFSNFVIFNVHKLPSYKIICMQVFTSENFQIFKCAFAYFNYTICNIFML